MDLDSKTMHLLYDKYKKELLDNPQNKNLFLEEIFDNFIVEETCHSIMVKQKHVPNIIKNKLLSSYRHKLSEIEYDYLSVKFGLSNNDVSLKRKLNK